VVDVHAHLLPGIDDGPRDMDAAVALAAEAAVDGVTTIAATPHLRPDHPRVRPSELAERVSSVRRALDQAGVFVDVVAGAEVDLYHATAAGDDELRLASYGQRGTDLLVETPYGELAPGFEDLLFALTARGYRLLLAHPERSPSFQRDPRRLAAIARRGTLLQITAASVAAPRASSARRLALALVTEGVAHVIASDQHGAGIRTTLSTGVAAAARVAPARAAWMSHTAPAAILAGEPLPPPPPDHRRRRFARRRLG
jgi:protein-tyrosine phosphatase